MRSGYITDPLDWLDALPPELRADLTKLPAAAARMQQSSAYLYAQADRLRDQAPQKKEEVINHQRAAAAAANIARGWTALVFMKLKERADP